MSTATATKPADAPAAAPKASTEIALAPPRLPYIRGVEDRFGIGRAEWKALVEAVYPAAKTSDAVVLALSYCRARKLDPFKRPVHIVPIWDNERGGYVESVWPGIGELRTTAFRTGEFAGMDAAEFGPTIEQTFEGQTKKGTVKAAVRFPEWASVTVYRLIKGERVAFKGPRVYWLETFSRLGRANVPNDMWQKRPMGQLEKCAEAAALRRAFPEELGDMLSSDEAEGVTISAEVVDTTPPPQPKREDFAAGNGEPQRQPTEAEERAADRAAETFAQTGNGPAPEDGEGGESGDGAQAQAGDTATEALANAKEVPGVKSRDGEAPAAALHPLPAKPKADEIVVWLKRLETVIHEVGTVAAFDAIDKVARAELAKVSTTQARNAGLMLGRRRVELVEAEDARAAAAGNGGAA